MFKREPRLRIRSEGLPKKSSGIFRLGQVFIENGPNTNNWVPLGAPKDGQIDAPWTKWERTRDELHGKAPYFDGGPFESIKIERPYAKAGMVGTGTYYSEVPFSYSGYYGRIKYEGGFQPPSMADMGIGIDTSNQTVMDALIPDVRTLGSMVWNKLKPQIEQGGLFVALAEARDVPRMLHQTAAAFHETWKLLGGFSKTKVMQPKFAADQFLNYQFGWLPFVNDVNQFLANIVNYHDRIQRLARENGQWIRRRATLVNDQSSQKISSGTGCLLWPGQVIGGTSWTLFYSPSKPYVEPYWEIQQDTTTYSTAVGQFRYWLPEFAGPSSNPMLEKLNAVRRTIDLFGLRASPSNIYKAIPWSWLIDWVSGVGRSIQALQDQTLDSMVAKYMSLSHHRVTTRTLKQYMPFNPTSGGLRTFEFTQIIDVKQRVMATSPFGFYLDASALTGTQLAILGALGLSRKRWVRTH